MMSRMWRPATIFFLSALVVVSARVYAHDPVFSPGPHVLFKDGYEIHTEFSDAKQGASSVYGQAITLKYGLSGDWVVGLDLPYRTQKNQNGRLSGVADATLSTKYRFWRSDRLGVQETAAVLVQVKLDSANTELGTGGTDSMLGLTYGYESLKWYRWASIRYRSNQNQGNLGRGNRLFVDIAGGYRAQVNGYREADTVWLLELNGEFIGRNALNGVDLGSTGGNQWFVSPGIMWTMRNFAIKFGVQIPVISNLNGLQDNSDYRTRLEFEWHL